MKKTHQLIITLLVCAAVMTACTKTEDTANEAVRQGEATIGRIMDFKQQMEEAKANPGMKSTSYMSMTDAVWNVEALFNLTYAYPELAYSKTVDRDTTLYLPVSSNDSVSINDLTVFYGQMFNAVQAIYQSVDLDDKQFLILDVEAGERHGSQQAIGLHTVQGSVKGLPPGPNLPVTEQGPFEECADWYYGEDRGMRNLTLYGIMDASDTLTNMLNARLVPVAPEGFEYHYTHVITKEPTVQYPFQHISYNNCGQFCEFYKENPMGDDYWMDTDMLNFHYLGERHLVKNLLPQQDSPIPSTHHLFQVIVADGKQGNGDYVSAIWHHTTAYYGHRDVMAQGVIIKGNL